MTLHVILTGPPGQAAPLHSYQTPHKSNGCVSHMILVHLSTFPCIWQELQHAAETVSLQDQMLQSASGYREG